MVRVVLGRHSGGVQVALDGAQDRCTPCSVVPVVAVEDLPSRVIVRRRSRIGTDDDGTREYGWVSAYDGVGVWSVVTSVEDDDGSGAATETATVTVPAVEGGLETTANVWDDHQRKWVVTGSTTGQAGGVVLTVARRVDHDA